MTGGSIEDLLESVVRSSHYSSRVRGTEEKVKDCSKFGFSGTTVLREGVKKVNSHIPAGVSNVTKSASCGMSMGFHLWRGFGALWGRCGPLARWLGL
jgi:hypothetical protein